MTYFEAMKEMNVEQFTTVLMALLEPWMGKLPQDEELKVRERLSEFLTSEVKK